MWKMYLQEKIAVISGGARGLGRAYTEAILKAGGKVPIRSNLYIEIIVTVKYIYFIFTTLGQYI